jgi:hypothetical protein
MNTLNMGLYPFLAKNERKLQHQVHVNKSYRIEGIISNFYSPRHENELLHQRNMAI